MATAPITAVYLEPIDELILKLIDGDDDALVALLKHKETLLTVAKQRDLDDSELLGCIIQYHQKFRSLPKMDDLSDYIGGLPQNAGLLIEMDNIRELADNEPDHIFNSLDVLIDHVSEQAAVMKLEEKIKIARRIANGGWSDPAAPQSKRKVLQGAAAAEEWFNSQIHIPEIAGYQPEEGEIELVRGRDGGSSYIVTAISAEAITPKPIEWLWPDRLPLGKMAMVSGTPDCGKSMVTIDIVSRVTTGANWPDGAKNTLGPRDVLMAIAEDDLNDTVIPRLKAAGANMERIKFIDRGQLTEFDEKDGKKSTVRALQLAADIQKLKAAIEANPQVALVAVDTLTSYFGDVNINVDKEIRPVMDALAKAFGYCKACFLGLVHHNKKSDVDALQKILGASSVAGSVRAIYGCSRDPENEDECYFTLVKGNLTKNRGGMKYRMAEKPIDGSITAPYVEWAGTTEHDANAVMAIEKEARFSKKAGVDKARLFLPMALEKGPRPARELYSEAEAEGISNDQMKRAKAELKVRVERKKDGWYWALPKSAEFNMLADVEEL